RRDEGRLRVRERRPRETVDGLPLELLETEDVDEVFAHILDEADITEPEGPLASGFVLVSEFEEDRLLFKVDVLIIDCRFLLSSITQISDKLVLLLLSHLLCASL